MLKVSPCDVMKSTKVSLVVVVTVGTTGEYGGWGQRNVGKKSPKLPKKNKTSWTLNIKGTKEGHKDRNRKPRTGSASSVSQ